MNQQLILNGKRIDKDAFTALVELLELAGYNREDARAYARAAVAAGVSDSEGVQKFAASADLFDVGFFAGSTVLEGYLTTDSVGINGKTFPRIKEKTNIRRGCYIVAGYAAAGKSSLLKHLGKEVSVIEFNEPTDTSIVSLASFKRAFAEAVEWALEDRDNRVIAVDSFKNLIYSGKSLAFSGLSHDTMLTISTMSAVASALDVCLAIVVNPYFTKESDFETVRRAMSANATGVVFLRTEQSMDGETITSWAYESRNSDRSVQDLVVSVTQDRDPIQIFPIDFESTASDAERSLAADGDIEAQDSVY